MQGDPFGTRVTERNLFRGNGTERTRLVPRRPTLPRGRGKFGEREEVVDEHRRLLQHPGALPGERQPPAQHDERPVPAAAADRARWWETASHKMIAIAAGDGQRAGQVGGRHGAHLPGRDPAHLGDPLVVEPVVPGPQERRQAERPDLLRRVAAGQQAGQVAALPVARGHDGAERIERAAAAAAGQPARDERQQRHRHQQRRHREQRDRRADRPGHGTPKPLQPEHHLRRPHHPGLRPGGPVVELGLVEGGQVDRAGHVQDPVLGVTRGEFGQDPLLLAQDHPGQPEHRRDRAEQHRARPHAAQADARAGHTRLGDQQRLGHVPAHHHLGRHPDPGEHLERRHRDQLARPRSPGDPHPGRDQARYLPGRTLLAMRVQLVDRRAGPLAAA